ncbi:MAG: DUF3149 domain-containing protein [Burkholderiales bacterium]|jgi:Tfp pilus assembly protein PilW|nr:DUF3149 domain-containing protein [Burkholderiales bacterium]
MAMLKELLFTDVGLLSLFCIIFMIVMSFYLWGWTKKKIEEDTARHEKMKRQAAQKQA